MSTPGGAPRSERAIELGRVLAQCQQRMRAAAPTGTMPLLRLERGAGLIEGARANAVLKLLAPLLALAAAHLYVSAAHATRAGVTIRPKLRVELRRVGAGLLAQLRYFGDAPSDVELRALFGAASADQAASAFALSACSSSGIVAGSMQELAALPAPVAALARVDAGVARGEICLRALWRDPSRRWALVRVMAGRREVAVPMFSVEQAVSEDAVGGKRPLTHSLASCLGEEPVPSALGRPALLVLRRRGPRLALRVEALLGHGQTRVYPVAALLQSTPWILGVVEPDGASAPILVLDPLALPGLPAAT